MDTRSDSSRRQFLVHAGLAVGGLAVLPLSLPGGTKRPTLRFAVVTDTHLGYQDRPAAARLWTVTAAELAKSDADFILHLGDIVDGGREEQYPVYKGIRDSIGKLVYETPGNHDPAELFQKHIRERLDLAFDHDWLRVLLVANARRDSHDGFLSAAQLQWMDEQLADAAKTARWVVIGMHVPAHANKHPDRGWHVQPAEGQTEFYKLLERHAGRTLALIHGHFHNGLRGWTDRAPLHEVVFPSALYNQDRRLEEQQAPGYNPLEFRPGYTQVTLSDRELRLEFRPVGKEIAVTKSLAIPTPEAE